MNYADLLNTKIIIHTDADFTPNGKRTAKIVRHSVNGKKTKPAIRLYVNGKIYMTKQLCEYNLVNEWLRG